MHAFHRIAVLSVVLVAACGASNEGEWTTVAEADLTTDQVGQLESAREAQTALFQRLLGALTESRETVGAAGSIQVCSEVAPRIAREIGDERKLAIGRTSSKLRNPKNVPPDWAAEILNPEPLEPVTRVHSDGRLATLHPIFLMGACLACHGAPDQLEDGVADALAKEYPEDRATGFAEGDLRGWFWVEVPAAAD